jgi:hypothetical protein
MSLFEEASLVITPNGFKAGKLYAVKGADLDVTRATSATRVNANGLIETVASNVPRIDYSGGGCPSILVEPQRTNLVLNSATVTTQTIASLAQVYTLSFYGTGTITLSGTHTATVVGTGTTRKTYTFTAIIGALVLTVSGTCTNGQLEAGSYATSYIPTTSASVTRNADVISKTGISSLIGQTEGTIFIDYYASAKNQDGESFAYTFLGGTSTDNYQIYNIGTTLYWFIRNSAGIIINETANQTIITGERYKIALAYKSGDYALYINGTSKRTSTASGVSAISQFNLNSDGFGVSPSKVKNEFNSILFWKTRLTNAELAELTTI